MSEDTKAHAEGYPCRPLPPTDNNVESAKANPGTAKRCADKQVGENRYYINSHVAQKQGE